MKYIGKYIVILDSDIRYATAFADYLNKAMIFEYTIQVFTQVELLLKFIHTERIAFALVQEIHYQLVQTAIIDEKIPVICLVESKELITENVELYKYQSMNVITQRIQSIVNSKCCLDKESKKDTPEQLVTIISSSGSIEYTVLALAIANFLSKQGSTLYVNLNPISCLEYFLWDDSLKGLSDILYYYRQGIEKVLETYQTYRKINNLFYIPQVEHYSDLFYLMKGDVEKLIQEAKEHYDCKVAVVCIKELNECTEAIINQSNQVMIECGDSELQRQQYERLVTMLKQKGMLQDKEVIKLPSIDLEHPVQKDYHQVVFHNTKLDSIIESLLEDKYKIGNDRYD